MKINSLPPYLLSDIASAATKLIQPCFDSFPQLQMLGGESACQPPLASSPRQNHSANLSRFRTAGVRTSHRCLSAGRPADCKVSNLPSLHRPGLAREKARRFGANSEVAPARLKLPRNARRRAFYLEVLCAAVLLLSLPCSAQQLGFGSVVVALPNMGPGGVIGMSFALLGGEFSPASRIGKVKPTPEHFSFAKGIFLLDKTDEHFCKAGCSFAGAFDPYSFSVMPIGADCSQVSGHLVGTFNGQPASANYSQMWCHLPQAQQMAGGSLAVVFEGGAQ